MPSPAKRRLPPAGQKRGRTNEHLRKAQAQLRERHAQMRAIHERLRSSERRYRELFNAAPIGYVTADVTGRINEANRTGTALLGRTTVTALRGQLFAHFVAVGDRPRFLEQVSRCCRGRRLQRFEVKLRGASGTTFPALITLVRARHVERLTPELRITLVDLTELKAAQKEVEAARHTLERRVEERTRELVRANEELSVEIARRTQLEGDLLEVSERERRRFGQDLHDETCQSLTGLAMQFAGLSQRLAKAGVEITPELQQLALELKNVVENTRQIAQGLHPVSLRGGLVPALEELAASASQKVACVLRAEAGLALPPDVELALYRITQEALANAVKHARASRVIVRLHQNATRLVLSIEDDGIGLPKEPPSSRSMGLDILGYRARAVGGRLAIENLSRGGMRVTCHLPLAALAG